jgi:hypothetical protein
MRFNFPLFRGFAAKAYHNIVVSRSTEYPYSLDDVLSVFQYYFQAYEKAFPKGKPHPAIKVEQIQNIIEAMPYIDGDGTSSAGGDIDPGAYEALIDKHFQTKYNVGYGGCDYNINHFFCGDIRLLRFYEELY